MKIESYVLSYYRKACEMQPLHVPTMPEGNQRLMESIRDEVVAIAAKQSAEGSKALLKALAAVPTQFPELSKEIERIDAEILKVQSDKLKRPACGPDMGRLVDFAKRIGKTHVSDLLAECGDDQGALLALLEIVKDGDEHWVGTVQGKLTALLVGYDTTARLAKLEAERRGLISFAEQMQESLVQAIGRAHAPHLVSAAVTAKMDAMR
ncbi:hypothetical protein DRM94_19650 [Aeromonas taiwanensis]|uniref:Uncharacterized protein n=1 Tax=Aeromonas taiwanensis TaxID=633417 RepID=A0A5F0K5Z4_9GAMM|nr:hypothetical protein [Aeromonas taiwanensis]TFF71619.1 hypothetical protein DRM93_19650 [Aeromonas taiwanensis]TFF72074.1 hypothetical protein DRM95_19820 [Aeromonas taiwanensis]TFF74598.1 hypothetical protein DRM94_19650 [Aeromonas taiwanensis]